MTMSREEGRTGEQRWEKEYQSATYRLDKQAVAEFLRTTKSQAPKESVLSALALMINSIREIMAVQSSCTHFSFQRIVPVAGTAESVAVDLTFDINVRGDAFLLSVLNDMTGVQGHSNEFSETLERGANTLAQRISALHLRPHRLKSLR